MKRKDLRWDENRADDYLFYGYLYHHQRRSTIVVSTSVWISLGTMTHMGMVEMHSPRLLGLAV